MVLLILAVAKNKTSFPLTLSFLLRRARNQQNTIENFVHPLLLLHTVQAVTADGFYFFCGTFVATWLKNFILLSIFRTETVFVLSSNYLILDKLSGKCK
jgi:hypothetical protein